MSSASTAANAIYIETSYRGTRVFQSWGDKLGVQLDRLNFIITQLAALLFALIYRQVLNYKTFTYDQRLCGTLIPGVLLAYMCYGPDMLHILILGIVSFALMKAISPRSVPKFVMVWALFYLSLLHIYRLLYNYGGYVLDITGPVMIATQKVTSLAFNIHDGQARDEEKLSEDQKRYAVRRTPSLLEFLSYLFTFQTLMAGPLVFYNDYIDFITGDNVEKHQPHPNGYRVVPPVRTAVITKFLTSIFFALLVVFIVPLVPYSRLIDDDFLREASVWTYMGYTLFATTCSRFMYYFAWKFGEAICNASGLGFKGWKSDGTGDWDLVAGLDIWTLEKSPNFKILLDNWNKTTQSWLKRVAYDRTPPGINVWVVFVLSALWHGFYPGYYFCFITGALNTSAARAGRRHVRPLFQGNDVLRITYDIITIILTRIWLAYTVAPFVLLTLDSSLTFYKKTYFFGHVGCILVLITTKLMTLISGGKGKKLHNNERVKKD